MNDMMTSSEEMAVSPAFLERSHVHVRSGYRKNHMFKHIRLYHPSKMQVLIGRVLHEKTDHHRHI